MSESLLIIAASPDELSRRLQEIAGEHGLLRVAPCGAGQYLATTAETRAAASLPADGLSDEQSAVRAAVADAAKKDILVIAGPGSGKTKTLIASLVAAVQAGAQPDKIAAITFTNNSAAELKVRLVKEADRLGLPRLHRVHVSTFHAWVAQLGAARIEPWTYPPVSLGSASMAVALHLKNPDTTTHVFTKAEAAAADRHLEGSESFEEMQKRDFNKIGAVGKNRTGFDNLKKAVNELAPLLRDNQITTHGTLMRSGADLAKGLPSGAVEWLFIDEAQDVNRPQAEFVEALQKSTGCRVFAIADDDQGIYKFRGASSRFLRKFSERPTTETFQLTRNFRSTQPIVALCRNWIASNWEQMSAPPKELHSERAGLPVVLLSAETPWERGRHAKMILDAAKKCGLIKSWGEVAALSFSPNIVPYDVEKSGVSINALADRILPEDVFEQWLDLCRDRKAKGDWHHELWMEFLTAATADQQATRDLLFGYPGLDDLYAALEVVRRLQPDMTSDTFAKVLGEINGTRKDSEKFLFIGDRPEPDYAGDKINLISLHSSKGMEFPVVWLTECGFALSVRKNDEEQGQPNLLVELGEWATKVAANVKTALTGTTSLTAVDLNRLACQFENRRLLYVGMSRATDLLIISAPRGIIAKKPKHKAKSEAKKKQDDEFKAEIRKTLGDVPYRIVSTDAEASAFAKTITAANRHPTWTAPHRYRVESFTSMTRQLSPGENREVEIPRDREFPRPQTPDAMIGDLFHRIMHLLCVEAGLVVPYIFGTTPVEELIRRVSTGDPAGDLKPLAEYLRAFFDDGLNGPYQWLVAGSKSEVPFSHVTFDPATSEEILLRGFIDLVRFTGENGAPTLILDYKTGPPPSAGTPEDAKHAAQLYCYRDALAAAYSCDPNAIELYNYYVATQELRTRSLYAESLKEGGADDASTCALRLSDNKRAPLPRQHQKTEHSMLLISWNIDPWRSCYVADTLKHLINAQAKDCPVIVCLQEADKRGKGNAKRCECAKRNDLPLINKHNTTCHRTLLVKAGLELQKGNGKGLEIWTRGNKGRLIKNCDRYQIMQIESPLEFMLVNIHLQSDVNACAHIKREKTLDEIITIISQHKIPRVFAGDWNWNIITGKCADGTHKSHPTPRSLTGGAVKPCNSGIFTFPARDQNFDFFHIDTPDKWSFSCMEIYDPSGQHGKVGSEGTGRYACNRDYHNSVSVFVRATA